jgi:hypothetical protein
MRRWRLLLLRLLRLFLPLPIRLLLLLCVRGLPPWSGLLPAQDVEQLLQLRRGRRLA